MERLLPPLKTLSAKFTSRLIKTMDAWKTQHKDDQPFPFMALPPEIRMMVYKEILIMDGQIFLNDCGSRPKASVKSYEPHGIKGSSYRKYDDINPPVDQPSLLEFFTVSRAIYQESCHIYFRHNTFYFDSTKVLAEFLSCIGPDYRRSLHTIKLRFTRKTPAKAMKLLAQCVNLRHLTIFIDGETTQWGSTHLMKIPGKNDLLKIRGINNIELKESHWMNYACKDQDLRGRDAFWQALQVLKLPRTAAHLKRQVKKDNEEKRSKYDSGSVQARLIRGE